MSADEDLRAAIDRRLAERREDARRRRAERERARRAKTARRTAGLEARHQRKLNRIDQKEKTVTSQTAHTYEVGDLVRMIDETGTCSHCGDNLDVVLGAVQEQAPDGEGAIVGLVDRGFDLGGHFDPAQMYFLPRQLAPAEVPDIIHASPEDVARGINAGWLPPGSEFYGCEFRIVQTRKPA